MSAFQAIILIVDPNDRAREATASTLESLGFDVLRAKGAEATCSILGEVPLAGILTEVQLAGEMNGYDLAKLASSACPGTRLIITSNAAIVDLRAGVQGFLRKPVPSSGLLEAFGELLPRS